MAIITLTLVLATHAAIPALGQQADGPSDWFDRGRALAYQGDFPAALDALDRAIALDANLADAYALRGAIFDEMGQPGRAVSDFSKAIRLNRELQWDAQAQQIVGDDEANGWLAREQRKGYEIEA